MALLEATGIGKNFGETHVLKDISSHAGTGAGAGHHRLLRLRQDHAAALPELSGDARRRQHHGERRDACWTRPTPPPSEESEVRKKRLHFGLVFQTFNLFPQYTALQNVTLARELLAKERPDYQGATARPIHGELESTGEGTAGRRWACPSGRATIPTSFPAGSSSGWPLPVRWRCSPDILCFDEPTSRPGPGADRRGAAASCATWPSARHTMIIVTHEMHFARDVADRDPVHGRRRGGGGGPRERAHRPPQRGAHTAVSGALFRMKEQLRRITKFYIK